MVDFDKIPLGEDIKRQLAELEIDYAFQPIFYADGERIFAREALMRPKGKTVLELIKEYEEKDNLHLLEVATLFGAVSEFNDRKYDEFVTINSFPAECLSEDEERVFNEYFGESNGRGIIEVLEYTIIDLKKWERKRDILRRKNLSIALDDFGIGNNNVLAVDLFAPKIVKLDRSFIENIDSDVYKQEKFYYYLDYMHERGVLVLAEGVETEAEYEFLKDNNIDLMQGFYLGRPE